MKNSTFEFERFLRFEEENNLFDYEYNNVKYWQFFRDEILLGIMDPDYRICSTSDTKDVEINNLNKYSIFSQFKQLFSRKKYDAFLSTAPYFLIKDGNKFNPFCDYFQNLKLTYKYNFIDYYKAQKNIAQSFDDQLILKVFKIVTFFLDVKQKICSTRIASIENIMQQINNDFNCNIDIENLSYGVKHRILKFKIYKWIYHVLLKNKFKCVYLVEHYNIPHFALIQAARELKIPVIEYQHGVIGKFHFAYNFYNKDANVYFPDYLFTFGDYWTNSCRIPNKCTAISVGFNQMDELRKNNNLDTKDKFSIVFYGPYSEIFLNLIVNFDRMDKSHKYKLICKLHPREYIDGRSLYPELYENPNIEVIDTPIFVYELLANNLNHVGVNSTVLFEAVAFSDRVFVLEEIGSEYMEDFIANGSAKSVKDEIDLFDGIELKFDPEIIKNNSDFLYKPGSLKNINCEIFKILG